jgi:hypothetical protein
MNGSDAGPEIRINAPAALALVIAAPATWVPRRGTPFAPARKASQTSTSVEAGSPSERRENGSTRPIVNAT